MHCVILGHVCIDKNETEKSSYIAAGGPAVFMQKIFSQLPDVSSTIVTPYGKDFLSLTKDLPLYPRKPTTSKTLEYENIMKGKKRIQKAIFRHGAHEIAIDKGLEDIMKSADIVYLTPLLPNISPEYVKKVLSFTKSSCLKVLLPQGYYRDFTKTNDVIVRPFQEAHELLPLVTMVIVSEQDGHEMEDKTALWTKEYGVIGIVTLGENGALALHNGKKISLPTKPVPHEEVVDSIGSGDIFSASFAYAYAKTHSLEKAGKFANEIARQCLFYTAEHIRVNVPAL